MIRQHDSDHCITSASPCHLGQHLYFDRQHGRKIADDGSPVVSSIGRCVYLSSGRSEVHPALVERIDGHRIAQHVDIAVALRQTFRKRLPLVSTGPTAIDAQLSIGRIM